MVGFNLNGYTNYTFNRAVDLTIPKVLNSVDGNTYPAMDTYYTTSTTAATS
jgi:hypothetical protein